jgi:hypothetical protein
MGVYTKYLGFSQIKTENINALTPSLNPSLNPLST